MFGLIGMRGCVGVDADGGVYAGLCVGVDAREGVSVCVGECACSGTWMGVSGVCIGECICATSCVFVCWVKS